MGYEHKSLGMNVYEAAERRILHVFSNHYKVNLSFSGGKDSIALFLVTIATMRKYGIDYKRLTVTFVDEEAIFPDVPDVVMQYRRQCMSLGITFYWLCLPWRHYNCTNTLNDDESWTCWDMRARDKWIRPMPEFALRWHPDFEYGMSYQQFFKNVANKHPEFVQLIGVRASESIQRMAWMRNRAYHHHVIRQSEYYIIYDWKDTDVWKIIKDNNAPFPKTYINLWRIKAKMRMSQIFAADTCKSIPHMLKFYPNFYDAIKRRCPNVDIVLLYWDTRMFKGKKQESQHKTELTEAEYKVKIRNMIAQGKAEGRKDKGFKNAVNAWGKIERYDNMQLDLYKNILIMLDGGDAKMRTYRAFLFGIHQSLVKKHKDGK